MSADPTNEPAPGPDPLTAARSAAAALTDFSLTGEQREAVVAEIKQHLHQADEAER